MSTAVDVVPFSARVLRPHAGEIAVWWEDPRDVERVEVTFAQPVACDLLPRLEYWQHSWPRVRVARNAIVGAGDEGWLAMDDWITGQWRPAAVDVQGYPCSAGSAPCEGGEVGRRSDEASLTWSYTFQSLDAEDVPHADEFPVRFRRTLKLRLKGEADGPEIESVRAFTDSEWREAEVCLEWGGTASAEKRWDGRLEAYNGYVIGVEPLTGDCQVQPEGSWRSRTSGLSAGVRARIRYAWNEDGNSFDRTILTLRFEAQPALSVDLNDVADGEVVYLPDFGVAVAAAAGYPGLGAIRSAWEARRGKTTLQRVAEMPEQTWERAWAEMPRKGRLYFVLGCEGGRQKFRLEPNGDLALPQNFVRRVPGRDTDRLLWRGERLTVRFGLPEPEVRQLADGYLPIMQSEWITSPIAYHQEAFATWLLRDIADASEKQGDDPVVSLLRFTLTNVGQAPEVARLTLQTADAGGAERLQVDCGLIQALYEGERRLRLLLDSCGRGSLQQAEQGLVYAVDLLPGESHAVVVKMPFVTLCEEAEIAALGRLHYDEELAKVAAFWRGRVALGMQIETPNAELNRFHKAHLTHMLIVNDREPGSDRRAPRCGGFSYGVYPDEGVMGTSDLDRRGFTREAERCLEMLAAYQGSVPLPGDFLTRDGVFYGANGYECGGYNRGQGWAMWGMAEHYRYSRDRAWLARVAPALVRACDWVTRERQRTMAAAPDGRHPIDHGFLPAGSLEDVTDYWHWLSSNAYASWGFTAIAEVLSDIDHPEAARLVCDAKAFQQDLMAGFNESRGRSPVVKLADGRYVPYYPPRLERRGRDFGWLREVLEGAMGLLVSGLVSPNDPAAQAIIDDYEDNLYLSARYGYANSIPDYGRYWFSRGGFSMQSNLLLHPAVYLARDDVKTFLRAFFNGFASTYYPETCMLAEHALPTLADARGDHFKTSDEANVARYLRLMLVEEHGQDLILGKAIPRAWLEHGKSVRVARALTYFGEMGYALRSLADEGVIEAEVSLPNRNPPKRAFLRLRHPRRESLRWVEIGGEPWGCFDAGNEMIDLPLEPGTMSLRAYYV
ncbi:MAG: hypothetical protein MUF84_19080 [Anaerolineae bacterium]|nr:hypothetical protein [Anaerolineae bacterium]